MTSYYERQALRIARDAHIGFEGLIVTDLPADKPDDSYFALLYHNGIVDELPSDKPRITYAQLNDKDYIEQHRGEMP